MQPGMKIKTGLPLKDLHNLGWYRWTAFECFTHRIPFFSLHFRHSLILISGKGNDLVDGKVNAVLIS